MPLTFEIIAAASTLIVDHFHFVSVETDASRFYGVMVSTSDSESGNPSSSLGRTLLYLTCWGKMIKNSFDRDLDGAIVFSMC